MPDWPNPFKTGATIGGLGSKIDGKFGLLRAGATPYEYIGLIYDAKLGKWISATYDGPESTTTGAFTTTSTTYVNASGNQQWKQIPNYKDLYTAGLRLQVWLSADLKNNATNATFLAIQLFELADGDTATATQIGVTVGAEITVTGTTATHKVSGWVDFDPGAPAKQQAYLRAGMKVAAGTGQVNTNNVWTSKYRFVG